MERAQAHQVRLVKKLRLAGITDHEAAYRYLDEHSLANPFRLYARAGGLAGEQSPATADGPATGLSVLAGGGARNERRLGGHFY